MSLSTNGGSNGASTHYKDILPMLLDSFIEDLTFVDIAHDCGRVFTDIELSEIRSEIDREKQIVRMFFILYEKDEEHIIHFRDCLLVNYSWLGELIDTLANEISTKDTQTYLDSVSDLKSNFPKFFDVNVHRLDYYWEVRSKLKKLKRRKYLVLCGELGFGKKWLAVDACSDYSVMKEMNHKVFWLDMHNCDSKERDLEILQRFKLMLGNSDISKKTGEYEGITNKILEIQQELRSKLEQENYKDCLLVLADVQNKKTLDAFNLRCKILITTRNKNITDHLSASQSETIFIRDGMTHSEAKKLFEKALQKKRKDFPPDANDVFDKSRRHPFLLNIIAQNLKQKRHSNWNEWIRNLCDENITDNKINAIIALSLRVLSTEEIDKYKMLGVFYHSVNIPVKILAYLWNMTQREAEELVVKFDKFFLVNKTDLPDHSMSCCLHFLYHSHLKHFMPIDKLELNRKVVESYNIEKAFEDRRDIDLFGLQNDYYFHHFIGYHLKQSNMNDLFSRLYLDLGFLGQKMRAAYLPNTIGDLKHFRREITGGDDYKERLVDSLLDFLPIIEENMFHSKDTTLLQNALKTQGILKEEAMVQAARFSDKIWFSERGHFQTHRQMAILPRKPKLLKLVQADMCLIALDDNSLMLADLRLDYNMERTVFEVHRDEVTDIEMFTENHFLSIDRSGVLCVWSIADERRRSVIRRHNSRLITNHIDFSTLKKLTKKTCRQTIRRDIDGQMIPIQHFYIQFYQEQINAPQLIHLNLAFANGDIVIYEWNRERSEFFYNKYFPPLHTGVTNIRFGIKLLQKYFMIVDNTGSLKFFNLKDNAVVTFSFEWPKDLSSPIRIHEYCNTHGDTVVIFVFPMRVIRITFPPQNFQFVHGLREVLYEVVDKNGAINCSALSEDARYLVLGTKQGIVVFDAVDETEVLRNNYSAAIVCIDIFSLDDNLFKYVIVSAAKGRNDMNIFALKKNGQNSVTWSHGNGTLVWLQGKSLFDVAYGDGANEVSVIAVDSKCQIHQLNEQNEPNWTITSPSNQKSPITVINSIEDTCYYGCEDGEVFNLNSDDFQLNLPTAVTYLQVHNNNILVAGALRSEKCVVMINDRQFEFDFGVVGSYMVAANRLVLLNDKSHLKILRITEDNIVEENTIANRDIPFAASDFKHNLLAIGTRYYRFYVHKFNGIDGQPVELEMFRRKTNPVKSVALSANGGLVAIGMEMSPDIEIYRIDTANTEEPMKLLQMLSSHISPVCDLKFSPWSDTYLPTILVSCSDQMCFWDISYALNNPLESTNPHRHSSRFNSSSSAPVAALENLSLQMNGNGNGDEISPESRVWAGKRGPFDKPELLSCIKFVGSNAEKFYANKDFTQFNTIDDEGVYYHLSVLDFERNNVRRESSDEDVII